MARINRSHPLHLHTIGLVIGPLINGTFASNRKNHSLCFYALRVQAAKHGLKPPKTRMNEIERLQAMHFTTT